MPRQMSTREKAVLRAKYGEPKKSPLNLRSWWARHPRASGITCIKPSPYQPKGR